MNNEIAFYTLPNNIKGPVGNYYANIEWNNGFEGWNLVRISTPGDGNCLFHAIANSFFPAYHTEKLKGKTMTRDKIISLMRKGLSNRLADKIDGKSLTYYESLHNGNTASFAKESGLHQYTLSYMQDQLNSSNSIGYGYMEFINNILNKDIYVLDANRNDIYSYDKSELLLINKGNRKSVILYYVNDNHYELVALRNGNEFITHFYPEHSLIEFLYSRVVAKSKEPEKTTNVPQ